MTQQEIYKEMKGNKKVEIACALHDFAYNRMARFLKDKYPSLSEKELKIKIAKRFLGESTRIF